VKVGTPILRLLTGLHEVDPYRVNLGSIIIIIIIIIIFIFIIINEFFLCFYAVSVIGHKAVMSAHYNKQQN
jgi:hypothetical protein